jgi:hypothetical protein
MAWMMWMDDMGSHIDRERISLLNLLIQVQISYRNISVDITKYNVSVSTWSFLSTLVKLTCTIDQHGI